MGLTDGRKCLPSEAVGLITNVKLGGAVLDEELVLFYQQWQSSVQDVRIVCMLDINLNHLGQQRWLRAIKIVNTSSIGNKAKLFHKVKEILNGILRDASERSTCAQQSLENPV